MHDKTFLWKTQMKVYKKAKKESVNQNWIMLQAVLKAQSDLKYVSGIPYNMRNVCFDIQPRPLVLAILQVDEQVIFNSDIA